MKRIPLAIIFLLVYVSGYAVSRVRIADTPDFAYPKTVLADAEKNMRQSIALHNWNEVIKALLQISVATEEVSRMSLPLVCQRADSCASIAPEPYKSILYSIEASMYHRIYLADRWKYRTREEKASTEELPVVVREWSEDMFCRRIVELLDKSLDNIKNPTLAPLKDIASILEKESHTPEVYKYYPYIADFLAFRALDMLQTFYDCGVAEIPFVSALGITSNNKSDKDASSSAEAVKLVERIYTSLFTIHRHQPAPLVHTIISYNNFRYGPRDATYLLNWLDKLGREGECLAIVSEIYGKEGAGTLQQYYALAKKYLALFPEADFAPNLRNIIDNMSAPQVSVGDCKGLFSVGEPIKVPIIMHNAEYAQFDVLDATGMKVLTVSANSKASEFPYTNYDTLWIDNPGSGDYRLLSVRVNDAEIKESNSQQASFKVREMQMAAVSDGVYVVKSATMEPIAGAEVEFFSGYGKNKELLGTYLSDEKGFISSRPQNASEVVVRIKGKKEENLLLASAPYIPTHSQDDKKRKRIKILTDRSVYHPGDTVKGCVIAYSSEGVDYDVVNGGELRISLINPNGDEVSGIDVGLGEMGRATFSLAVPTKGITGRFRINTCYEGNDDVWMPANGYVEVADYKVPTFFVEINEPEIDDKNQLIITGSATSYSGMAVVGADVDVSIRYSPYRYSYLCGRHLNAAKYKAAVTTDESGEFVLKLGCNSLDGTPYQRGCYAITAEVTSPAGETQGSAPRYMLMGNSLSISTSMPPVICADSVNRVKVEVVNAIGNRVELPVKYKICHFPDSAAVAEGSFEDSIFALPLQDLPSGRYIIKFSCDSMAATFQTEAVIWRTNDKMPPYTTPLWAPCSGIEANGKKRVMVPFGSSFNEGYILCRISDETGLLDSRWLKITPGMKQLSIDPPSLGHRKWVQLSTLHDCEPLSYIVTISNPEPERKLEVITTSFRDKVTAGDMEEWTFTFRYSPSGAKAYPLAAIAVVTDKALDAITPFNWNFSLPHIRHCNGMGYATINMNYPQRMYGSWNPAHKSGANIFSIPAPMLYLSNVGMMHERYVENVVYASAATVKSAPKARKMVSADAVVMEGATDDSATETGTGGGQPESMAWRPCEMPVALFDAGLYSDKEGEVKLKFMVPDFNTTWKMQMLGYDTAMYTARCVKEVVASKPVMVSLTAPRFFRTGDFVTLRATVMCSAEKGGYVKSGIKVYDASGTRCLYSTPDTLPVWMDADSRVYPLLSFQVPTDADMLLVRAYSCDGTHTDGEQLLIGVLPSSQPVIDSRDFYLPAGVDSIRVALPPNKSDERLTLTYCDNPMWLAVEALPTLSQECGSSVFSPLMSLVGNATASSLITRHSEISNAIRYWCDGGDTLSSLAKDGNLKLLDLEATIWDNAARAESVRKALLSRYLDSVAVSSAISSDVSALLQLQHPSGGWRWLPDADPDFWVSEEVIRWCGYLNRIGALPADEAFGAALERGIDYCDSIMLHNWKQCKILKTEPSLASGLDYLYLRSMMEKQLPKVLEPWRRKIISLLEHNWRTLDVSHLATAVIIASSYNARFALSMLESLRQKGSVSPENGMWYDNLQSYSSPYTKVAITAHVLEAFHDVAPESKEVDLLRQWLVNRLQTQEWGENRGMASVIQTLIATGTEWVKSCSMPEIWIGNSPVELDAIAGYTGSFTKTLDGKSGSSLTIKRHSPTPAWGAVMQQYVSPISDVKASSTKALSICKKMMKDGREITAADTLKLGDKIMVQLILTAAEDMQYITVVDSRGACMESVRQVPGYVYSDGVSAYLEPRTSATNIFVPFLRKGSNVISYECYVMGSGLYTLGIASAQCQKAPGVTAHSGGANILVAP